MAATKKYSEITNFETWTEVVRTEYLKLYEVHQYLNDKGLARYYAYVNLYHLATFCSSATELIEWIDSKEGLETYQIKALTLEGPAARPIGKLRRIAAQETAA